MSNRIIERQLLTLPFRKYTSSWEYSKLIQHRVIRPEKLYATVDVYISLGNFDYFNFVDYSEYIQNTQKSFKCILENNKNYFENLPKLESKQKFKTISGRNEKDKIIRIQLSVYDELNWLNEDFHEYLKRNIAYNNSCLISSN